MFSVEQICANLTDSIKLDNYLKTNISEFTSFFERDYSSLKAHRWEIVDCIIEFEHSINELDFTEYYNSLFVLTLLEFSAQFRLQGSFDILYNISINNNLNVGHRQKASKIFLLETKLKTDHINNFDQIISNLQIAYETEEDNEINVLATFGNYFLNAILNTADVDIEIVRAIIKKIIEARNNFSFLLLDFIDKIVSITPNATEQYSTKIRLLIEQLFLKQRTLIPVPDGHFIEEATEYKTKIDDVSADFNSIRKVSMEMFNSFSPEKKSKLRNELLRGVKIIDKVDQLYAYMTLYGAKHKAKLIYAFDSITEMPPRYNIIDWACGQGLASMVFFDYYKTTNISKVILNEPSELALKRATLHLTKYNSGNIDIITVNNAIEDILTKDISTHNNLPNIHLFSNILDIKIDLKHLTEIIINNCKGVNYFICVSPYIDDLRKNRIDLIVNYFQKQYSNSFVLIKKYDRKNPAPTMVIRIFKCEIA